MDDNTDTPSAVAFSANTATGPPVLPPEAPLPDAPAPHSPPPQRLDALSTALAGFQAGMVGVLWMLAFLGTIWVWGHRSFWTDENLFASAFYGGGAVRYGFSSRTLSGLAVYLILYSLLGAVFALLVRDRLRLGRRSLVGLIFSLAWFYLSFHWLWKTLLPIVYLLYADRPMMLGHLIYGLFLARFPRYLPAGQGATAAPGA